MIDVLIAGAGAAGLATAIFTRRHNPAVQVVVLDGARRPGAKILVSGGSRCNVTNAEVTERDFNGATPAFIRRVLRAFPVEATVAFFREIGVSLHEEHDGKLFPDSNQSRDVLEALLSELTRAGAQLRAGVRIHEIHREGAGFHLTTSAGEVRARRVVLATGGLSLPKTGSDGAGYRFAQALGHRLVPTTPGLVPLILEGERDAAPSILSGVSQPVRLDLRIDGRVATRIHGALLWTHFGVSGPAALDISRHWLRARLDGMTPSLKMSVAPDRQFPDLEDEWLTAARNQPRTLARSLLARMVPASVADVLLPEASVPSGRKMGELTRDERRRLIRQTLEWELPVIDSRGYNFAEVTAGGIDAAEVTPATMESRLCGGLYLVGEILDVDGRLGGFNFQWAWASAQAAGQALARPT